MRSLGVESSNRLLHLHDLLESVASRIKNRKLVENNEFQGKGAKREKWRISLNIVAFI